MLVNRMKTAVAESKNLRDKNIVIEAWGKEEYYEKLDDTRIIMLGPQVSMLQEEVKRWRWITAMMFRLWLLIRITMVQWRLCLYCWRHLMP